MFTLTCKYEKQDEHDEICSNLSTDLRKSHRIILEIEYWLVEPPVA